MSQHDILKRVLDNLEFILYLERIQKNVFKQKAYKSSIEKIKQYCGTIQNSDDISRIGLGDKIRDKVIYIYATNKDLPQITENRDLFDRFQSIKLIESIHNIGHKKATDLVMNHYVNTIEDLRNNKHLLNKNQNRGLDYYFDINKPIPREEMDAHSAFIIDEIDKIYPEIKCNIVGSYRRGSMQSGDIDVIICIPDNHNDDDIIHTIVNEFQKKKYVPKDGIFANGKTKFMGMCKLYEFDTYRRIDILLTNKLEYPFALLYFTGSKNLNIHMREKAKKMGYELNEKGFIPKNQNHIIITEYDIFKHLDMEYIKPENRDFKP